MAFRAIHSNQVERLAQHMFRALADSPPADPLAPDYVLVDNQVLGEWVNLQLALQQGIAANIRYVRPHELFWTLARALVSADIPPETPLSKAEMGWKLYGLLGQTALDKQKTRDKQGKQAALMQQPLMAPVVRYLAGDDCHDLKRFQLATSIADLFDQYLVYRPDWLLQWEKWPWEKQPPSMQADPDRAWQAALWRALVAEAGSAGGQGLHHRAAIEQRLLQCLQAMDSASVRAALPLQRLSVFGITSMPPLLLQLLVLLGAHMDVTLYVLNPCQEYWSQISAARALAKKQQHAQAEDQHYEIGNPLLASQGVQVRDYIALLQEYTDDIEDAFVALARPASLLQAIQQEILSLSYKGDSARTDYVTAGELQPVPEGEDHRAGTVPSVHVHCCHSAMREVEVLHDQLRDILHRHPDIQPRDVVVMMPQVAPYVPYIHAVFNSVAPASRIPYNITDRTQQEESPLLNSIDTWLQLPDSRMPLSGILALLEVPAVQRRFDLDANSVETVKQWLVAAGVRWGLDAQHRAAEGLPAYGEASWAFGLDRLFAGYAMQVTEPPSLADVIALPGHVSFIPLDDVEGGNSQCFDSFLRYWQTLLTVREQWQTPVSAGEWAERIRLLVDTCYLPEGDDEQRAIRSVLDVARQLDEAEQQGWCTETLPLAVVRAVVKPALQQPGSGHHAWREGVKFCSLLPMRGVPFKVVYVLGMNLDDYPRRVERKSFDLMRKDYRPGDRASRIDDRWLFLEALLSARQFFHVSYVGRDMHRNEKREPSVVLAELMDYCQQGYALPAGSLVTAHPLQPFSEAYFRENREGLSARLVSFNEQACLIANARQRSLAATPVLSRWVAAATATPVLADTVALEDFVLFFSKPWDWFFKRRHKVWLDVEQDPVSDEEPFAVADGLEHWGLRQDLINSINAQAESGSGEREAVRDRLAHELARRRQAEGRWPLGKAGQRAIDKLCELQPDYLWASHGAQVQQQPVQLALQTAAGVLAITGNAPVYDGCRFLVHSASKLTPGRRVEFAIRAAITALSLPEGTLQACQGVYHGKDQESIPVERLSHAACQLLIAQLALLYLQYRDSGLPFDSGLGHALLAAQDTDARNALIDYHWYEQSEWFTGMLHDIRKHTYFGHVQSLQDPLFTTVCSAIWQAIGQWKGEPL